jgi:hypothetical protein
MIRLRKNDFEDADELARIAKVAKISPDDFKKRFQYVVEGEAPPLSFNYP